MLYSILLFLHLVVVGTAFGGAVLVHLGQRRLRAAGRVTAAREALALLGRASRSMPVIGLGLLVTGAALTQVRWPWSTPWVDVSILGLVAMQAIGGAVLKPRVMRLGRALGAVRGDEVPDDVRAAVRERSLWVASHVPPALGIGVMYVMVTKPGMAGGIVELFVAAGVGVAVAAATGRAAAPAGAAAGAPAIEA